MLIDKPWEIQYQSPLDYDWHSAFFEDQENCTFMVILLENQTPRIRYHVYKNAPKEGFPNLVETYSLKMGKFGKGLFKD